MNRLTTTALVISMLTVFTVHSAAQWTQMPGIPAGETISSFESDGTHLFATAFNSILFISTDHGDTWFVPDSTATVHDIVFSDSGVFGLNSGVVRSTDHGESWFPVDTSLSTASAEELAIKDTFLFTGSWSDGIFRSTLGGSSWEPASQGLPSFPVLALAATKSHLFAGVYHNVYSGSIYSSNDDGANWTVSDSSGSGPVQGLVTMDSIVFAIRDDGFLRSTDQGASWTLIDSTKTFGMLHIHGSMIFLGTGADVLVSSDQGSTWTSAGDGLPPQIYGPSLASDSLYVYAGLYYGGAWRRSLSEIITPVFENPRLPPVGFRLEQNYPNPFNSGTTIRFTLQEKGYTTLGMYDVLGREVAMVVDGILPAGEHSVRWNPSKLPGGVYVYRLRSGPIVLVKKLLLLP